MNVIFLDHYGVMCLAKEEVIRYKDSIPTTNELLLTKPFDNFDNKCVSVLNNIIKNTDIEIIISSDWKSSIEKMSDFYKSQGIIKAPIGFTNKLKYSEIHINRSKEILSWVDANKVDRWLAIDDIYLGELINNFMWCNFVHKGISKDGMCESIISFFNNTTY